MKRLVFITQAYQPTSTILGVTRAWVEALAERCAGVDVIAASADLTMPRAAHVRLFSLGRERGAGKVAQAATMTATLARVVPGAGAVLAHMVPRYALLAAPLCLGLGRPLALWYAQGGADLSLTLAVRLVNHILTPTRGSFPLGGPSIDGKVAVTGHGIDTQWFSPGQDAGNEPRMLFASGRVSPSKRYDLLLDAVARLPDRAWRLRIAGPPLYASDLAHQGALEARVRDLGLADVVQFAGSVPYERMPHEYRAAWALAHTSGTGSLDKVVLEAMACGTPVVSCAPTSREALGELACELWCAEASPEAVAKKLNDVLSWTEERRAEVGKALRKEVERSHDLRGWADQTVRLLGVG